MQKATLTQLLSWSIISFTCQNKAKKQANKQTEMGKKLTSKVEEHIEKTKHLPYEGNQMQVYTRNIKSADWKDTSVMKYPM